MPSRAAIAMALAAVACTGRAEPVAWEACADAACRQASALATWDTERDATADRIAQLEDPVELAVLVSALSESRPGSTEPLCPRLQPKEAREHCRNVNLRAHLWAEVDPGAKARARPDLLDDATPTRIIQVLADADLSNPLTDVAAAPDMEPCAEREAACQVRAQDAAIEAAEAGDPDLAAARCQAISAERWRNECMFRSAESTLRPRDSLAIRSDLAVEVGRLCLASVEFRGNCYTHIGGRIAKAAPAADATSSTDAAAWTDVGLAVAGVIVPVAEQDEATAGRLSQRIWSEVTWHSVSAAADPTGFPLAHLPPSQTANYRAALAAWVVFVTSPPTLSDARGAVEVRQARQEVDADAGATPNWPKSLGGDLWNVDLPGEDALAWVYFTNDARRAFSEDPAIDLDIALLEAAARARPVQFRLLDDGLRSDDALVRWTAARLLGHVDSRKRSRSTEDSDPLVAGRLAHTVKP